MQPVRVKSKYLQVHVRSNLYLQVSGCGCRSKFSDVSFASGALGTLTKLRVPEIQVPNMILVSIYPVSDRINGGKRVDLLVSK